MIVIKQGKNYSIVGVPTGSIISNGPDKGKPSYKYSIMNNTTKKIHNQQYWSSKGFIEDKFYKMEMKSDDKIFDCANCGPNQLALILPRGTVVCGKCMWSSI